MCVCGSLSSTWKGFQHLPLTDDVYMLCSLSLSPSVFSRPLRHTPQTGSFLFRHGCFKQGGGENGYYEFRDETNVKRCLDVINIMHWCGVFNLLKSSGSIGQCWLKTNKQKSITIINAKPSDYHSKTLLCRVILLLD